ncbi:hypothetical protein J2754_001570 [Halarchaeum solikamskense]|uniref:hypothetical protein n=1 Tax=Halarchaeum nitratireducens TaxID=489913 RepID=UPI001B3AA6F3|nr:hypothetical protein [Halarchaeum solikamskense]MBP2251249.1 hypothetical protein [Halarchaeum solikamskense]
MLNLVAQYWNDVLTVAAFLVAVISGYYQVQHYRAQKASLSILDVTDAEHGKVNDRAQGTVTRYDLKVRAENTGREPTTILGATLSLGDEELELDRVEGSTKVPIAGDAPPNMPTVTDSEIRVPGNGVLKLKYEAMGKPRDAHPDEIEGALRIRTVSGDTAEQRITFQPHRR